MAKVTRKSGAKKGSAKKASSSFGPNLSELEDLFQLMGQYQVGELDFEDDRGRIQVRLGSAVAARAAAPVVHAAPVAYAPAPSAPTPTAGKADSTPASGGKTGLPSNHKQVTSPFVGTFYRSSKPGAEPYAKEGQTVKKGQALCIVEAMKLMNEIESDFGGKIVSCLVENGQPVEFGEPLFVIEVA